MIELIILLIIDPSIDGYIEQTLASIRSAEEFGADTSSLVERLEQVVDSMKDCLECRDDAKIELNSIIDEANSLREDAINDANLSAAYAYVSAAIIAILLSIVAIYVYNRWKIVEHEKFMNMRIREREEE